MENFDYYSLIWKITKKKRKEKKTSNFVKHESNSSHVFTWKIMIFLYKYHLPFQVFTCELKKKYYFYKKNNEIIFVKMR